MKEPPKSLVSKHRQGQKQQYEVDDEEANKPKALAFISAIQDNDTNVDLDDILGKDPSTKVFKRPKHIHEVDNGKAKNAKALLLTNAFKMQNNLMDAM